MGVQSLGRGDRTPPPSNFFSVAIRIGGHTGRHGGKSSEYRARSGTAAREDHGCEGQCVRELGQGPYAAGCRQTRGHAGSRRADIRALAERCEMPAHPRFSSFAGADSGNCRYHLTAQRMTSAGKRKPRKARASVMSSVLGSEVVRITDCRSTQRNRAPGTVRRHPAPDRSTQAKAAPDLSDASNVSSDPTGEVRPRSHKLATKQARDGFASRRSAATTHPRPLSAFACCLRSQMGAFYPWNRRYLGNVGYDNQSKVWQEVELPVLAPAADADCRVGDRPQLSRLFSRPNQS